MSSLKYNTLAILGCVGIVALWCFCLWIPWWLFGPETFWQRAFCVVIFELPVAVVAGVVAVFLFSFLIDLLDDKQAEAYRQLRNFEKKHGNVRP